MNIMKQRICGRVAIAILGIAFPGAAFADISAIMVLRANSALNLNTGAIDSSGGDLLWNGSTIAPQGTAKVSNVGNFGAANFAASGLAIFAQLASDAKATPIAANLLVPGDVFVAVTNGGRTAKVMVIANTGGSISLRFTTFGATAPAGVPLITNILNNSSLIAQGLPNYGIPPSSLFVVTGASLADPGDPVLQSSAEPGISSTLNGASITVSVNGVTTNPGLYYTSPRQLAGVLPASTPVGVGTFTVTYRGQTSAPAPIEVVPTALGINTYNGDLGVATDAVTGALLTYSNSASPGQAIILWSTGLGANPADSDSVFTSTPHSVGTPLQIYIGGIPAAILYQGSAGYPGVNQINVTVPDSAPTGCWVSLAAISGTVVSNIVTIPINRGGGACLDQQSGVNGNQISPSGAQTFRTGLVSLIQAHTVNRNGAPMVANSANGAFIRYTGLYAPNRALSPGGCLVNPATPPIPGVSPLRAGIITMSGPAGTQTLGSALGINGQFFANLAAAAIPSTGGTFTFNGGGGTDVGPFTTTLTLANPLLTWTNQAAAANIDRAQGFPVTWSGGNPGSYVYISGGATSAAGVLGTYLCMAPADARQFTVPAYVLLGIPEGSGGAVVQNTISSTFSASGLDLTNAIADVSFSTAATYR